MLTKLLYLRAQTSLTRKFRHNNKCQLSYLTWEQKQHHAQDIFADAS